MAKIGSAPISRIEKLSDHDFILELAEALRQAQREGAAEDIPEGARYITISDTLVTMLSERLKAIAGSHTDEGFELLKDALTDKGTLRDGHLWTWATLLKGEPGYQSVAAWIEGLRDALEQLNAMEKENAGKDVVEDAD